MHSLAFYPLLRAYAMNRGEKSTPVITQIITSGRTEMGAQTHPKQTEICDHLYVPATLTPSNDGNKQQSMPK